MIDSWNDARTSRALTASEDRRAKAIWRDELADVGMKVRVDFAGALSDGTEFDSSAKRGGAVEFVIGSQQMLPAFERAVCGMKCGERKAIRLSAAEAYGDYDDELVLKVPLGNLPSPDELKPGLHLIVQAPIGSVRAKVLRLESDGVVLNLNHELAGHDVLYDIQLLSISHASAIEREAHPAGCSCNQLKESIDPRYRHGHDHGHGHDCGCDCER
ncbi:MAG: peptidylprolyl isomerase [Actinobacteria bacterium]|nr:peptidylprolyl isomerase [Actinomycetota bacterium]